jgi:hypothetical protein
MKVLRSWQSRKVLKNGEAVRSIRMERKYDLWLPCFMTSMEYSRI